MPEWQGLQIDDIGFYYTARLYLLLMFGDESSNIYE